MTVARAHRRERSHDSENLPLPMRVPGNAPGLSRRAFTAAALAVALNPRAIGAEDGVPPEVVGLPPSDSPNIYQATRPTSGIGASFAAPPSLAPEPIIVNGRSYLSYVDAAPKEGQWYPYTCEFDVAHIILATFGIQASLEQLVALVDIDLRVEPYAAEAADGIVIFGGDIGSAFSGNFVSNIYAKTRGSAMTKAFDHFGCNATPISTRSDVEAGLTNGDLMWLKCTVDFAGHRPTSWITPDGTIYPTVLDNDHCVAAIGFNDDVVVVRDPLGPTNTYWERPYEYEVPWPAFMDSWGSSGFDGLMITPPVPTGT